ncbi:MAG TPA: nicotinate-nucleotide adenylyltransferase [Verrucomicrobiae bacterium]|jgi:nicotinate-nucleotide adenylyltransferase|nr:nicotinate-nucleotide adenylyltransferase [Verrucomicrobiae bacterium]
MKIGLFGGTFDPIHWGHLRSAEEVAETFALDRVYFIPAAIPPHKRGQTTTPAADRLRMVRLAVARNPRFRASTIEISRMGVSYSIDTIRQFASKQRKGDSLYFIIGLDAFREIGTWKEFADIFPLCHFIVTSRPGNKDQDPLKGTGVAVKKLFCYDFRRRSYRHRSGTRIFFIELTDIAISASEVRALVKQGKSIRYLVPSAVEKFIQRRGLYGRRNRAR